MQKLPVRRTEAHIFVTILVVGQVDGTVGTTANLASDDVLVDAVVALTAGTLRGVFCHGIKCLLHIASEQ